MTGRGNLISLVAAMMLFPPAVFGLGSAFASLQVVVQEEHSLVQLGGDMVLSIRLAPGITASVWSADNCSSPPTSVLIVTASGKYTIPITNDSGGSVSYFCLSSSDNRINEAVPVRQLRK